jgi:hypothetical protein
MSEVCYPIEIAQAIGKIITAARDVSTSVEHVGLGVDGAIGALYLTGNALRAALGELDALNSPAPSKRDE